MDVQELVGLVPWTFVAQICNLFIQMYLIKRFLFKPVNEMLEKRRALADAQIREAEQAKADADAIKTEYEQNMKEAKEKANEIKIKTQEEFELDRQMLAQEGKMKVQEEYEKKEKDLQVQQRIAQSAEIGRQTKRRMVARDDLLNKLYQDAKDRLAELSLNDKEKYTAVLKDLILQGLIKIEEPDIVVRCRKVDMEIVRAVIPEVRDKYVKMMKDECALDVDVTVTLNEDDGKMLPPPPDGTPMISCSGGIIMEGHSGRLVLDNTFDKRLEVCFHDLKPVTRKCLFPSC